MARNGIGCISIPTATNRPGYIIHLALPFRIGSNFRCFLVYKISSQLYSAMAAIDMSCINFYELPPVRSPCSSLKSSMDKPFKTNRKINPPLQSQIAVGGTKAIDKGIVGTQRYKKPGGDRGTNYVEDLCFPSIEDFGSPCNSSSETEKNIPYLIKNLDQCLSDGGFLDIDDVLGPAPAWTAEQPHFQGGALQPST